MATSLAKNRASTGFSLLPIAIAIMAALLIMAIAPIGYVGHGWDDQHYLDAARCASQHGYCLPGDHWARRFTLVIPASAMLAMLGESRIILAIVPLAYSLCAIALFTATVERRFGRRASLIGGLCFAMMPVFSERMLHFGVDIIELTFLLAAVHGLQRASERNGAIWFILSGTALSFAVMTRPTSLAMVPVFVAAALAIGRWQGLGRLLSGLAGPLLVETLIYWSATGDPLRSWRLSLAHGGVPTGELAPGVDIHRSPLFNVDFIDHWRPASGIELHWTVDALLNLMANGATFILPVTLVLLLLQRRRLGSAAAGGRLIGWLMLAGAFHFAALVYALAIDPKPRMFLPLAAIACALCGVMGSLAWAQGRRMLVIGLIGLIAIQSAMSARSRAREFAALSCATLSCDMGSASTGLGPPR
ncbi:glycosyltransferase family 39 protein [Sphingobium yanoikuyae]|jgi:4-amino-4-deoxy-L-arabinose transferase-like glycosyltransferase|uniref:glycosyltransferase family 39 protein n=1 Tax=Sphingobium yanoikuyae TaxID=13690 RepID=UPI00084710FD|nr:glycosyltransferase family 39 protein [Sphingobium yanoikuyae]MDG2511209.1 glycosyltransferase family 39 protein [Sphingobium yanoikuyae]